MCNQSNQTQTIAALEAYYDKQEDLIKEGLLALKSLILAVDQKIVPIRKHRIPFFTYKGFSLGFLWVYKRKILVGFVEDKKTLPESISGRKKDRVFTMMIDPLADIPIAIITQNYVKLINKYNHIR